MSNATTAQRRHWTRIAALGCMICRGPAEIAHAHGGSIVERMQEPKAKGVKLQRYNWLTLPLCDFHHRNGPRGQALDRCVLMWELNFGTQASMIDKLGALFGIDLWALAKAD